MRNSFLILAFALFFGGCSKVDTQKIVTSNVTEVLDNINQTIGDDGAHSDVFGYDVDMDMTYSIIGDPGYDELFSSNRGCAYIYTRTGTGTQWTEKTRIKNAGGKANDNFGNHVAMHGNYAVTCTNDSIYVFKRFIGDSWVQSAAFVPAGLQPGGLSVSSLDIYGDYIVVGHASRIVGSNNQSGAVYFYKRSNNNWILQNTFFSPDNQAYDRFGSAVSIHGNFAVVGASRDYASTRAGKAYVYILFANNWIQQATLTPSFSSASDRYGCSVSLREEYAIVGASSESYSGDNVGTAFIFKRTGSSWAQQVKLNPSAPLSSERFGYAVTLNQNYAVVGNFSYADGGGSIHVFNRSGSTWNFLRKETNPLSDRQYFASKLASDSLQHFVTGGSYQGAISFGTLY